MASKNTVVVLIASTGEIAASGWGSSGTATRKLHGLTEQTFDIVQTIESPPQVGYAGAGPIASRTQESGEFSMAGIWTYEEAPKYLNGFFAFTSETTAAADPYDHYWSAPVASTQANATYPIEFGPSSSQAYRANGCLFNDLSITGEAAGFWQFTIGGMCKSIQTATGFTTGAQADARTMTPVAMMNTDIRIDSFTSGSVGSSSGTVAATLINFELRYNPNRHIKYFAGSANPQAWGDDRNEGSLRTLLEFNGSAKAYVDELIGSSTSATSTGAIVQRLIAIRASAASTASTSGYISEIDYAGIIDSPVTLWDDRDGNLTVDITWRPKFSTQFSQVGTTGGNYLAFKIANHSSGTS